MTTKKVTPGNIREALLGLLRCTVRMELTDPNGLLAANQLIDILENPTAAMEEPTDSLERWARGRKDPDAFRPSNVLWKDWLEWCERSGEPPGTWPAFLVRLKTKAWLRPGRTRWKRVVKPHQGRPRCEKAPTEGWWGLRT